MLAASINNALRDMDIILDETLVKYLGESKDTILTKLIFIANEYKSQIIAGYFRRYAKNEFPLIFFNSKIIKILLEDRADLQRLDKEIILDCLHKKWIWGARIEAEFAQIIKILLEHDVFIRIDKIKRAECYCYKDENLFEEEKKIFIKFIENVKLLNIKN